MKYFYLLIIGLLLLNLTAQSQSYQSIFGKDTTRWNVFEAQADAGGTMIFYTFSDTLINSKLYHTIYHNYFWVPDWEYYLHADICGYIYEDIANGKYWFYKEDSKGNKYEQMFMNMNLSKGDTFKIITDFRYMWADTAIVDSVYYIGNRKIIELNKYHFSHSDDDWQQKIKFIEGIGASYGFYMSIMYEQYWEYALLCKYENEKLVYSSPDNINGDCYLPGGAIVNDNKLNKQIIIFPNPTSDFIYITTPPNELITNIKIFSALGVKMIDVIYSDKIDVSELPSGIYFFKYKSQFYKFIKL